MAVEEFTWVETDHQFHMTFFYCRLCPLSIPFLEESNAESYRAGHSHNSYHRRRLELLERGMV
jgi:hypothetical protein